MKLREGNCVSLYTLLKFFIYLSFLLSHFSHCRLCPSLCICHLRYPSNNVKENTWFNLQAVILFLYLSCPLFSENFKTLKCQFFISLNCYFCMTWPKRFNSQLKKKKKTVFTSNYTLDHVSVKFNSLFAYFKISSFYPPPICIFPFPLFI